MDIEIDEALMELLKLKSYEYIGIDVRIRVGKSTMFQVATKEEALPENTDDDDISRLKEKLELLKQIDKMLEKLKEFEKDTDYVPYIVPFSPWPSSPGWVPYWRDAISNTISWTITDSDGNRIW